MIDTTTALEVILFLVSATTLGFSVWSLWHSHIDHRLLHRMQLNGIKRLTMRARLMRDISRVLCAGLLCGASVVALHEPPDRDFLSLVLKSTVLTVSFLLGVAVYGDWQWRRELDEALDAAEGKHGR